MRRTAGGNSEPVVTGLADGGFVVTWTHDNGNAWTCAPASSRRTARPARSTARSTTSWSRTCGNNSQPAITALPNGNWAVAYTDSGWGNEDVGITLTICGPDGEVVNAFEHVNVPGDPNNESDPDITVLDNGFIVVSWTYPASGVDGDIFCRIFDQDGNPITVDGFGPKSCSTARRQTTSSRRFPAFSPVSSWPPGRTATATAAAAGSPRR